jgi:ribosomal protein S9
MSYLSKYSIKVQCRLNIGGHPGDVNAIRRGIGKPNVKVGLNWRCVLDSVNCLLL